MACFSLPMDRLDPKYVRGAGKALWRTAWQDMRAQSKTADSSHVRKTSEERSHQMTERLRSESGITLVVVLLMMAILLSIIGAGLLFSSVNTKITVNYQRGTRA